MTRDRTTLLCDLRLPVAAPSVGIAREYVNLLCDAWSIPGTDNAELCVSELTSNTTKHAHIAGSTMRIVGTTRGDRLRIEVHDHSPIPPELQETPLESESGNGLFLVDAVAADWGYFLTEHGKAVWFEIPTKG
jgi:anti-sigma regulatory factor (Ser/Thr protein kinase)